MPFSLVGYVFCRKTRRHRRAPMRRGCPAWLPLVVACTAVGARAQAAAAGASVGPTAWLALGPFAVGKTETDAGPIEARGGVLALLAQRLVAKFPRNPERTVALRKLLEAKDCAVRSLLWRNE